MKRILFFFLAIIAVSNMHVSLSGCAQIGAPTGGLRDSLPPKFINANPKNKSVNFKGNRITLNFDEYVHLEELQQNLLVSPSPKNNPYVDFKLRSVIIRLRDTLEPNTTYTINLGNSIHDINENNAIKNFSYVFSTGATLDSLEFSGKVVEAETGKVDSTLIVLLYKNLSDSAVLKLKPKYIARVDSSGNFTFQNLAPGEYKVYALKDNFSKKYDSKADMFAFADSSVIVNNKTKRVNLFAYIEEKEKPKKAPANNEKKLRYTAKISGEKQDILSDLVIEFNKPLKNFDKQKIILTDTLNNILNGVTIITDSTNKKVIVKNKWTEDAGYKLIILKDIGIDSAGLALAKSDTIRFKTKRESDYAVIKLKFLNFDKTKNPVLQFVVNKEVIKSYPLTTDIWNASLFNPGEYELRILFDENKNGKWDEGNFALKRQPEKVYSIPQKLSVSANFEKDVDIELPPSKFP